MGSLGSVIISEKFQPLHQLLPPQKGVSDVPLSTLLLSFEREYHNRLAKR